MAFTIPDKPEASAEIQAGLFQTDIDILVAGFAGNGVVSGCGVTAQGTPSMTVAVASGTIQYAGQSVSVTAGNVTITAAHATLPRFDLVVADNTGAKSVVAGIAATNPLVPPLPASSVALATVYVPAADTTIEGTQIVDKRVMVNTTASSTEQAAATQMKWDSMQNV